MKKLTCILWVIAVVFIVSCHTDKYNSLVRINPDGSCSREYLVTESDSAFMHGDTSTNPFPMKIDPTWKITWKNSSSKFSGSFSPWPAKNWISIRDSLQRSLLTLIAHKDYPSVEAMTQSFRYNHSEWKDIIPKMSLKKKFKFFFTYYTYSEIYPKYNPIPLVPINNYFTEDEIKTYFCNNPKFDPAMNGIEIKEILDDLDKKKDEWLYRSMFEVVYRALPKYFYLLNDTPMDSIRFLQAKDSVYTKIKDKDKENIKDNFGIVLNTYFKTNAFTKTDTIRKIISSQCDNFGELWTKPFSTEINYHLLMPGKILQTSSKQTHDDTLVWKIEPSRFFFTDYELIAESRVANIWAFVISAIFLIIVAASFFIKRK